MGLLIVGHACAWVFGMGLFAVKKLKFGKKNRKIEIGESIKLWLSWSLNDDGLK